MADLSILVLGAGELGMSVLRNLAAHAAATGGITVSVLLRPKAPDLPDSGKPRDREELQSMGVQFVRGDLVRDSVASLAAVFRGFHTVIGCTGFVTGGGIQRKLAHAVLDAGVKRYVPWQFGVDYDAIGRGSAQDLFDEQMDVRDLLRGQSRTEWIILSTGMFTSFLFEPAFGVVDLPQNTVHALGNWQNAVTVTTPEDIGNLTAEVMFAKPRIANQIVYTAGDTVTYADLAGIVDKVLDRKVERVEWSVPMLKRQLALEPGDALRKYRVVFAEGKGVAWPMNRTFNAERNIPVLGVEGWARQNLR